MALINRMSRLFTADVHAVLDRIEEPDVLLKHAVREMEEELARGEQRAARARARARGARRAAAQGRSRCSPSSASSSTSASRAATRSSRARSSSAGSRRSASSGTSRSAARAREGARRARARRRRAARAARRDAAEGRAADRDGGRRRLPQRRLRRRRRRGRGRAAARAAEEAAVMSAAHRMPSLGAGLGAALVLSACGAALLAATDAVARARDGAARRHRAARARVRALRRRPQRRARRPRHDDRRAGSSSRAQRGSSGLPLAGYVLVHVGLVWLVRSLYYYSGLLPALADLASRLLGAAFAVWAAQRSEQRLARALVLFPRAGVPRPDSRVADAARRRTRRRRPTTPSRARTARPRRPCGACPRRLVDSSPKQRSSNMKTNILVPASCSRRSAPCCSIRRSAATPRARRPTRVIAPVAAKRVEVVFVLDTTGSMGGLIDAAKEKIWSIASTLAQAQQAPEISIGLVAYRDRGDAYVTQVVDLNRDLDSMYAKLMDFEADGGGDGPEAVNEALDAAIQRMSWSQDQKHVQGRVLGRRRAAAHGLSGRREVSADRRRGGRQGHRRQHDPVRQPRRDRRAVAAHRLARPRALLHGRAGRQRRRDRNAVRRADRDARRGARRHASLLRLAGAAEPRWPRRSTRPTRLNEEASVAARARRGAFNVSDGRRRQLARRAASSSTTSRAAASTSPRFRPRSCRRRVAALPRRGTARARRADGAETRGAQASRSRRSPRSATPI